jgi:hypothetical protein
MPNVYNDTVGIITYDPQYKDTLAKLIRGEINPNLARTLVDPDYVAIKPAPVNIAAPSLAKPSPGEIAPIPVTTPTPMPSPILPSPLVATPPPVIKPSSSPAVVPEPFGISKTIPNPIAPPVQPPELKPLPEPLGTSTIQPSISPSSIPAPIVSNPAPVIVIERPVPIAKPSPVEMPTPKIVENPINLTPQPLDLPKPAPQITQTPIFTPQPIVGDESIKPSPQQRQIPSQAETPTSPTPKMANQEEKTWQTQAIDLLKVAQAKTKEFTNTIPSKAQRFGQNVRVWAGKAIDKIQEWRTSNVE